jgi:hypothetical protein
MPGSYDYYKDFCICPLRQIAITMHTTPGDVETSSYPVTVYNVNLVSLGVANTKAAYISLWNSDSANQAKGMLTGGYGPFTFTLIAASGVTPPAFVYGNYTGSPVNQLPIAAAGADQTITNPVESVTLSGSSSSDPDGSIATYFWLKEFGPAGVTIASPNAASTVVSGLTPGEYIFRLTVTDNFGATSSDTVKVTVNPSVGSNHAPTADAGFNRIITLPTNSTSLSGSGSDIDGFIASYSWAKQSGPAGESILSPGSANTTVTNLVQGTYVFRLTVTDNQGATGFADVQVIVNAAPPTGIAPSITTQPLPQVLTEGQTLTLTVVATGTAPLNYQWRRNGTAISGANSSSYTKPSVIVADSGSYDVFISNAFGSLSSDVVNVTVNPGAPSTYFARYGYTSTDPMSAILAGTFTSFAGSVETSFGAPIVMPATFAPADQFFVIEFNATEASKTSWSNTTFNYGSIPGFEFRDIVTVGSKKFIVSRNQMTLDTTVNTTFS